jgi:hypothetical protein
MRIHLALVLFNLFFVSIALAESYSGAVFCKNTQDPIAYANIGVVGKGIGTVSGTDGWYSLGLDPLYDKDTLMFSCIGYYPYKITVGDFRKLVHHNVTLERRIIELAEVVVRPVDYRNRTLGNTTRSKSVRAGFKENQLGYEMGVEVKINKTSFIEKVNINIASTSYDTLFYRLNIYSLAGGSEYQNILTAPVYLELPADKLDETIEVELSEYNIRVSNDILITLEHIRDLGSGHLYFSAGLRGRTHYRKTSQANWESISIGVGISVDVVEEK